MKIWVDGDSCPRQVREILGRTAKRLSLSTIFVANSSLPLPDNNFVSLEITSKEEGSADDYIVDQSVVGDLVVTRDIPLAARLVELGVAVVNDRGVLYNKENVKERLAQRDFMYMLREAGVGNERSSQFGAKEVKAFANQLDRQLTQMLAEERFRKRKEQSK